MAKSAPPEPLPACARIVRDDRIDRIVRMMIERAWEGGKSAAVLAEEWGLHPRTVSEYASIASALVDRLGGPLEDWIKQKLRELETVQASAMARTKTVSVMLVNEDGAPERDSRGKFRYEPVTVPDADHKAAIYAVELQFKARGALIQRRETVQPKPQTIDEKRAYAEQARAALAELDAELAEHDGKVN